MAASPPPKGLSERGGDRISLFIDTDLGTHLALNVAADSTIRALKSQVATEHADAFPDLGPVVVKSFQVLRKGALYHLSDSMPVRSAFAKVKAGYFLHVKMVAAETDRRYCRNEDRGKSSDKLPPMLKGGEDAHAHDVHPSSSLQQNTERKSTEVCLATDVRTVSVPVIDRSESYKQEQKCRDQTEGVYVNSSSVTNILGLTNQSNSTLIGMEVHAREEDLLHSVGDREQGFVSGDKEMGIREETLGELHALDDVSQEKDRKRARVTGSLDTSSVDIRETNDSKTTDAENFDKLSLETASNSREVLSNTPFQQEVDGNIKEDSIQLKNPSRTGKNKKRKNSQLVTSKGVSAQKMTEPSTGAVEVPKAIGEDLLHENQALGVDASNIEMTSRDETKVIPPDMIPSSSQLNSGSQITKHVQLGTDAQATCDLAADQSNINRVHEEYRNPIVGDISVSTCIVIASEEKAAEGTNDGDHDESAVGASNMEKDSKSEDVLETLDSISQAKKRKQSKKVTSVGLTSMDTDEAKEQCGYGKKADKSDIIPTQQGIVNDSSKQHTRSNVQQGIENPNGDVKRKKRGRHHPKSSKDDPTRDAAKSSEFIMNASSTQNTSFRCLDANQITVGNIGEETADEKDQCRGEKVAEPVVSTKEVNVGDPRNVQQGDPPISSPRHKSKGKPAKLPSTVLDPSHSSVGAPDENAYTEIRESDSLRYSEKIDDLKDIVAESTVVPADGRAKSTKHQRNKVSLKDVPTDSGKGIQSLGEEVSHVPAEDLKGENCTKAELFQGGTAIDAPSSTGQMLQKKRKKSSKARAPKIEECDHSTHGHENQFANDIQDKHVTDICVTHNNENTVGSPRESPVVHKDATTVTCEKPNARKGRKKSSKTVLRSQDTNLGHCSDADLMNSRTQQGAVIPKGSFDVVEPNDYVAVRLDNDRINFFDHFSPSVTNGPAVSAENNDETLREGKAEKKRKRKADTQSQHAGSTEPNDLPESHDHTEKTSLADNFSTGNVAVPFVSAENMNREDGNVKKGKGKKKSRGKADLIKPETLNPTGGNLDTGNCTQDLMHSDVHTGRMEQANAKEDNDKVIHNDSILQQETEDATRDSTLEKKAPHSMFGVDSQTNLPIEKDHAHMSKEQMNSTSQTKPHGRSRKHDGSIDGRTSTNPDTVSNLVQSFSMCPQVSNESAYGTPPVNRVRVAVRKVPRKMYEQVKDKSKKDFGKRGTGTIFGDTTSESSDEVLNTRSEKTAIGNSSSTSADSGISSAALYESDLPDDDGIASLSQSDIDTVLRGTTSYKKARLKPTELLDDTEVPDSQPPI